MKQYITELHSLHSVLQTFQSEAFFTKHSEVLFSTFNDYERQTDNINFHYSNIIITYLLQDTYHISLDYMPGHFFIYVDPASIQGWHLFEAGIYINNHYIACAYTMAMGLHNLHSKPKQ